ncbi:MAG TPA: rod shape-determining protein RodA [Minicystis sp.]|nr:rod shape-determining protein RodA [Minicystis sp.]
MLRSDLSARARDHFDWPLFIAAALIAVLGVVNLYSATSVYSGNRAELYISQVQWLVVGGIVAGIVVAIDYRHFERLGYVLYTFGVFSLILVFVLAKDVRGSSRWIEFGSFRFQPSEFMKLFLVIAVAKYLHDDPRNEGRTLRDLAIPAALTLVPAGLILKQPDLGTATILVLVFLTMIAVTRIQWQSALIALIGGVVGGALFIGYGMRGYQADRLTSFLSPESDITGRGWHAHHARVAIGDGGLFGNGFMKGTQNQFGFIPDQYTDFPFPVFAEEWGFVGCIVLLALYAFLTIWAIRVASQAKDRFGAILAIGAAAVLFWHAVINLGMTSGVLPVVGVTLPLFSYGGSSVTTMLLAVALVMNVSIRRHDGVASLDRL